jgi:hypothetical protein
MTYNKDIVNDDKTKYLYKCNFCDYNTLKKGDYRRHIQTEKHKNNELTVNSTEKTYNTPNKSYICDCGKSYKHNQSLYNHKKKCAISTKLDPDKDEEPKKDPQKNDIQDLDKDNINHNMILKLFTENNDIKNLLLIQQQQIMEQQKQLGEQQKQLIEFVPKIGNVTNNNTLIKQNFNINVFLNERCKNAINMNDFIKQIKLTLEDLDLTKNKGLETGLSNAIIQTINKLSLFERPLHCTDPKRETLYIKDNDLWEKDSDKTKIKGALHNLNKAHFKLIQDWIAKNPDFKENDAKQDYFAYLLKTCSVNLKTIDDKIIKKICLCNNLKINLKEFENINYD